MKQWYLALACALAIQSKAQTPQDALRSSWYIPTTGARSMAAGGVMGSLGGDISAAYVNPAGIGMYKNTEFVFSGGWQFNNNKLQYRGTDTSNNRNAFLYGPIGFVSGAPSHSKYSKTTSSAFALSVNQLASFNNRVQYRGFNSTSSFSEQYLEELVRDRADTIAALSNYIFGSSLAFRTYLVDKDVDASGNLLGYQSLIPISTGVQQEYDAIERGGIHEINLTYGANYDDRLYLGGGIGIPIVSYQRNLTYSERDISGNGNNDFNYFTFNERFKSSGVGVNARLGMIYKASQLVRVGFAMHTPSLIGFRDEVRASMTTDTEAYAGVKSETSDALNSGNAGIREYNQTTPWRFIGSASFVLRDINDTKKQRGFISADVEYVTHGSSRFTAATGADADARNYYRVVNDAIKDIYKANFNIKVGAELKFDPIMVRAGFAHFGSPYRSKELNASRMQLSGGLGIRTKGIFIDLTYAHFINRDVSFPYLLNDKPNTFAEWRNNRGIAMLTIGVKL
jgi:hypothetical protein